MSDFSPYFSCFFHVLLAFPFCISIFLTVLPPSEHTPTCTQTYQLCFSLFSSLKFFHVFLKIFLQVDQNWHDFLLVFTNLIRNRAVLENNILLYRKSSVVSSVLDGGHGGHFPADNYIALVCFP